MHLNSALELQEHDYGLLTTQFSITMINRSYYNHRLTQHNQYFIPDSKPFHERLYGINKYGK